MNKTVITAVFCSLTFLAPLTAGEPIRKSLTYVKGGVNKTTMVAWDSEPGVVIGIGHRREMGPHGFDISSSIMVNDPFFDWEAVRLLYLRYLQPDGKSSFYGGIGGSYRISGVTANAVIGYEFLRDTNVGSFIELGVGKPTGIASGRHSNKALSFNLTIGFGF